MPVDKQKLLRFQILNECFRNRHREYTLDDLKNVCNKILCDRYDMQGVSRRTIQNDIRELEMPPYCICLDENLRIGHKRIYRYANTTFSLKLFSLSDEERNRLESAIRVLEGMNGIPQYDWISFCLKQIVSDTFMEGKSSPISFQNNPDLYGIEHFKPLLKAIADKQPLRITYKPYPKRLEEEYVEREETTIKIFPYHLKQFNDRWFLVARQKDMEKLGVYPIDRITTIHPLYIPFEESPVDIEEFFDNIVGVSFREETYKVLLRVKKERYPYILSKPIHWSQTELRNLCTETHKYVSLNIGINNELISLLLSFGDDIEVIEPSILKEKMKKIVLQMYDFYKQ